MTSDSPTSVPALVGAPPSRRIELDNLIRRELRVGDPSDPMQVANALMQRYADTPSARSLVNEAKGLPFLQTMALSPPTAAAPTATSLDLQQAKDDIEADLRELLTANLLKDITPELQGWAQAIRAAVSDGEHAAAVAIDTRQRDRTFAVRRQLADYARAARLVGALNPRANDMFRSLAQSLDECASVLLVMMGDAIANTGIAGGRYLMQVPFTELQSRRQTVLNALRNLNGSSQHAFAPDKYPRGVDAYRQLHDLLESQGQGELRSLLSEPGMTRIMDQLIDRAGQGVHGLRALGATVMLEVQQFSRLIAAIHWGLEDMASPPLLALEEALQLFIDGFRPTGGIRLIGIARPSILNYGLYGNRALSPPELRLQALLQIRGQLASGVDCMANCACDSETTARLVLLDQGVQYLDRAVDLYAGGVGPKDKEPEVRAAAYGAVLDAIGDKVAGKSPELAGAMKTAKVLLVDQLVSTIPLPVATQLKEQEIKVLQLQESQLHDMVTQMGDSCGMMDTVYREIAGKSRGAVAEVLSAARQAIANKPLGRISRMKFALPDPLELSNHGQAGSLRNQSWSLWNQARSLRGQAKTLGAMNNRFAQFANRVEQELDKGGRIKTQSPQQAAWRGGNDDGQPPGFPPRPAHTEPAPEESAVENFLRFRPAGSRLVTSPETAVPWPSARPDEAAQREAAQASAAPEPEPEPGPLSQPAAQTDTPQTDTAQEVHAAAAPEATVAAQKDPEPEPERSRSKAKSRSRAKGATGRAEARDSTRTVRAKRGGGGGRSQDRPSQRK